VSVQEEPADKGAWQYLLARPHTGGIGVPIRLVARPASASPAA
jgi:2-oxoglutarate dehydrogenase complex dehydrogenase (E1) component-like enzyme